VLVAYGNQFLGFVLYVQQGRLIYEAVSRPAGFKFSAPLAAGVRRLAYRHAMTERPWRGGGQLIVDGAPAASQDYGRAIFGRSMQGLQIGRNTAGPVSHAYVQPFNFTGVIRKVKIRLETSPYTEAERDRFNEMLKAR
jgi:arylsulfatase